MQTPEDVDALVNLDNRRTYWESEAYSASSYCGYNAIRIYLKPLKRIKYKRRPFLDNLLSGKTKEECFDGC